MKEFKEKGINIQETTTEELRNQYINMLKKHLIYLTKEISKILSEYNIQLRNIDIENIIEKYLLTEIKYNGMYTIEKLNEDLQEVFEEILKEEIPEKEKIFTLYLTKIKEPIKRNQINWIEPIINDFQEQFINLLKEQPEISKNIDQIISILKQKIKIILQEYQIKFVEDYNDIQKNFVMENTTKMQKLINSLDNKKLKLSKYEKFFTLIELSNYELIEENNILYIIDKTTKEKTEITEEKDVLRTKDNKIRFINDEEKKMQGFINEEKQRGFVIQPQKITLTTIDTNETITILKVNKKYEFKQNLQSVTNIKKLKQILREIRDNYPNIFDKIMHDRDFTPIIKAIAIYNKKIQQLRTKRAPYINELGLQPTKYQDNENNINKRN